MIDFIFPAKKTFFSAITALVDSNIYSIQSNVLPFTPSNQLYFTDSYPQLPAQTQVDIFLNGQPVASAVTQAGGYIYTTIPLPLGAFLIEIYNNVTSELLRKQDFKTLNLYTLFQVFATAYKLNREQLMTLLGNLSYQTVSSSSISDIYGRLYGFEQPLWMSFIDYQNILLGSTVTSGVKYAYQNQSTVAGITQLITAFGGNLLSPIANINQNSTWTLYSSAKFQNTSNPYVPTDIIDTDLVNTHYFISPASSGILYPTTPGIQFQSGVLRANGVILQIQNVEQIVSNEGVIRAAGTQIDALQNQYIDNTIAVLINDSSGITYVQGTDFNVIYTQGEIQWLLTGKSPIANSIYFVSYTFFPVVLLRSLFAKIKPATVVIHDEYFRSNGSEYDLTLNTLYT